MAAGTGDAIAQALLRARPGWKVNETKSAVAVSMDASFWAIVSGLDQRDQIKFRVADKGDGGL